jgi:hypothetical protein
VCPYNIFSLCECDFGACEAMVVGEGGPGGLLAIGTVAEDWALIGAFDGVLDGLAEAGT